MRALEKIVYYAGSVVVAGSVGFAVMSKESDTQKYLGWGGVLLGGFMINFAYSWKISREARERVEKEEREYQEKMKNLERKTECPFYNYPSRQNPEKN